MCVYVGGRQGGEAIGICFPYDIYSMEFYPYVFLLRYVNYDAAVCVGGGGGGYGYSDG